jgi:hypothetical protein
MLIGYACVSTDGQTLDGKTPAANAVREAIARRIIA